MFLLYKPADYVIRGLSFICHNNFAIMASVIYGKCYLWRMYYGKCNYGKSIYGKSIMAYETEPFIGSYCSGTKNPVQKNATSFISLALYHQS